MKTVITPPPPTKEATYPALVVFSGNTEFWWLRWLKPGFRHCFMVLEMENTWVVYDPLSHQTKIALFPVSTQINLAAWYEASDCTVVPCTTTAAPPRMAPFFLFTCVEAIKRVLGIHDRRILTPWQLHKKLRSEFFP